MSTLLTDEIEPTEDWQAEELEGHIRAIEAILLELADASTLRAAKECVRETCKNEERNKQWARIYDQMNKPYDKHAEAVLDTLICKVESKSS